MHGWHACVVDLRPLICSDGSGTTATNARSVRVDCDPCSTRCMSQHPMHTFTCWFCCRAATGRLNATCGTYATAGIRTPVMRSRWPHLRSSHTVSRGARARQVSLPRQLRGATRRASCDPSSHSGHSTQHALRTTGVCAASPGHRGCSTAVHRTCCRQAAGASLHQRSGSGHRAGGHSRTDTHACTAGPGNRNRGRGCHPACSIRACATHA